MAKGNFNISNYNSSLIGMSGISNIFYLCHLPFILYKDVYGALALEGSSGTGKTTIVKRLGLLNQKATGGRVGIFSADKARYEDFVGIPIPDEATGQMKMYSMPHAVAEMETVLVDEINRASVENQEKWLSLIATRLIDSLPTKCKYIFTAMNPVLAETQHDVYEGVIPLDKSLGERMVGIVKFPHYSKMPSIERMAILRAAFNQVNWEPSQEDANKFMEFLAEVRENYEAAKNEVADSVFLYVDTVQGDLNHHSKGAMSIEARRAQFITFNILGMYALNKTLGIAGLEVSALQALQMSFPNALWEQEINTQALKTAHDKSAELLKVKTISRSYDAMNTSFIDKVMEDLTQAARNKVSKEEFSSLTNQNLPVKDNNMVDHYCYALGIYLALAGDKNKTKKQSVLKEQEFGRIENIALEVIKHEKTKAFEKLNADIKANDNKLPLGAKFPAFIENDINEEAKEAFKVTLNFDIGCYSATIADLFSEELTAQGHGIILQKIAKCVNTFREINQIYTGAL